jgi:hypothetical protein
MSYDLDPFLPPAHGDPLAAARAAYAGLDGPVIPRSGWRERMHALAAALTAADPTLARENVEVGTDEEHVELYAPDEAGSGLQVLLFADAAYVHLAPGHAGAEARAAWEQAWAVLRVLEREGGFRTYDPQLDRLLDLDADLNAVRASYARAMGEVETMDAAPPAPPPAPPVPPTRPWWKFWG